MHGCKSRGQAYRFLAAYGPIAQHFRPRWHPLPAPNTVEHDGPGKYSVWVFDLIEDSETVMITVTVYGTNARCSGGWSSGLGGNALMIGIYCVSPRRELVDASCSLALGKSRAFGMPTSAGPVSQKGGCRAMAESWQTAGRPPLPY
jgi:hypothetical protein